MRDRIVENLGEHSICGKKIHMKQEVGSLRAGVMFWGSCRLPRHFKREFLCANNAKGDGFKSQNQFTTENASCPIPGEFSSTGVLANPGRLQTHHPETVSVLRVMGWVDE